VSHDKLGEWLNKHIDKKPAPLIRNKGKSTEPNPEGVKTWVAHAFKQGIHNMEGSRNQKWMSIACELSLSGFNLDSTILYLRKHFHEQDDFKEREWLTAVKSGWNYADKIVR
jgi:hypothetical protein